MMAVLRRFWLVYGFKELRGDELMGCLRWGWRAATIEPYWSSLVKVLTAAGITARIVAHQFRHTRRGPRRAPNASPADLASQIIREISALGHALRPTFVMQFRSFYS